MSLSTSYPKHDNLLFVGTPADKAYLPYLKSCVGGAKVFVITSGIGTLYELVVYCRDRHITGVFTTCPTVLAKLISSWDHSSKKLPSIDNYAGSLFKKDKLEYLIINPLDQLFSVPYGKFLTKRYLSKLVSPNNWMQDVPEFNWCILNETNLQTEYDKVSDYELCAVDIETFKENLIIRCVGFTFLSLDPVNRTYRCRSLVLPLDSEYACVWAGKFLATSSAKILQNGKYDIAYLIRYGIIINNYVWDTAALMHCWLAELPKDLGSLGAFFVRDAMYWKDLAKTNDLEQYYLYNARDTYTTALALLGWIREAPKWAWKNYRLEFPVQFPCILAEMTGIKRDMERLHDSANKLKQQITDKNTCLSMDLGVENFNTNSTDQKSALLKILGCGDLEGTSEPVLAKARLRHPLNSYLLGQVSAIQKLKKLISTYLTTEDKAKELNGRILYALNPHGTDTGRLASKEHHFWCGLQIQNIPRGKIVKSTLCADDGFLLGESDLEQAESRDTAYLTGDKNLIAAVSSGRDFHATNAASFFGIPYEAIYNDSTRETIDKEIRDLAKRVNHGASYYMMWETLINTMGEDKIRTAQRLLSLPARWTLKEIAQHLLDVFAATYPGVRIDYPLWVKSTVAMTGLLIGATGWTRQCFNDPTKSKLALNGYIAHGPQSLNGMTLNKAWLAVFYQVALPNPKDFKLLAQIHDSILFQYRVGYEHLAHKVKELMEIPVTIKDIKNIERTFTVPAALKCGKKYWSEL